MARVCVDSNYFNVDGSGNLTFIPSSVGIQQLVVFTSNGSFTKASYPGLRKVRVRVVGGGGGGGGADNTGVSSIAQPSGSGGGYSESLLDASALGASESVVIGAAGLGGTGGNTNGGNGGTSSFGSLVTALGGFGASASMPVGAFEWTAPGTSQNGLGVGQIRTTGTPGGHAHRAAVDGTCQTYPAGDSGGGYGAGGGGRVSAGTGGDATGYGGAGAGAISFGGAQRGGNGTPGAVFIEIFY